MTVAVSVDRAPWAIPAEALDEWRRLADALAERGPAPCEEGDREAWWPSGGQPPDPLALRACEACPVRGECLDYAVKADEREGLWGGLTRDERRDLRKHLGVDAKGVHSVDIHGEERTYTAGCSCELCRRANARRIADWRARRRYAETTKSA